MSTHNAPEHREWKLGCKVYIGNLADGASKADIQSAFSQYGTLKNIWVARNPPGFAFVEFADGRDAEDACRRLDGTCIAGARIKAEMSHGRSRRGRQAGGWPYPSSYPMYPTRPRDGRYNWPGPGMRPRRGVGHYNNGDYPCADDHRAGPPPHMERGPRDHGHPRRPRSPLGAPEKLRTHFSRSRSNSLGKSPPPVPRTARPRTPPSRTASPERH